MALPVLALNETTDFTIAASGSLTASVHTGNRIPTGIFMSAAWTAASITLQTSLDDSTFYDVYDLDGVEYALTVGAGLYIPLNTNILLGVGPYLKVRSGTSATPVNQAAERVLEVRLGSPDTR